MSNSKDKSDGLATLNDGTVIIIRAVVAPREDLLVARDETSSGPVAPKSFQIVINATVNTEKRLRDEG